jgi:hypothetical protein
LLFHPALVVRRRAASEVIYRVAAKRVVPICRYFSTSRLAASAEDEE